MKLITSILFGLLLCVGMYGQTFDSDSRGEDGPFNPPKEVPEGTEVEGDCTMASPCTVTVPLRELPDHVFNFTTVTIGQYVTVRFRRNAANTPVFILAQGDVAINGTIDVSGQNGDGGFIAAQGGPGGFSGGLGGVPGNPEVSGAGSGPGAGGPRIQHGSSAGFGTKGTIGTGEVYGIPELLPLIGGSGGGGSWPSNTTPGNNGGSGGGALLIASSGVIDLGSGSGNAISANGGNGGVTYPAWSGGGGSGGAIRLVAPGLRGTRALLAAGGQGGDDRGGLGRIRLEFFRSQYTGSTNPPASFGLPGPVFPPITPRVRLVSVAGVDVPGQPTADISTADLTLPPNFTNPVPVVLEATNIPSGTQARVIVAPQLGAGPRTITPVTLTGTVGQPKRATVNVNLPTRGVGIISAVIDTVVPEP